MGGSKSVSSVESLWSLSRRIDAQLPLQALEMALAQRQVPDGLIHHSNRGRQYFVLTS